jgi:general secretion pathway protein B
MSFILDALKKSENERQRQVGPSLADVQVRQRSNNKPWWVVAVAALLVVNLGVLIVVLVRDGDAKTNAPQAASGSSTDDTLAPDARGHASAAACEREPYAARQSDAECADEPGGAFARR